MIRMFLVLMVSLLAVADSSAEIDSRYLQGLGDSAYYKMDSDVLNRSFHIFVMLPDGYDLTEKTSYPTVYILDGGGLYPQLVSYYRYLRFGDEVPDAIIVGISYGSGDFKEGNFRSTDYTAKSSERAYWGGAGQFQKFLNQELIPHIEKSYRSDNQKRILFGQSMGGQFVLYSAKTKPGLFWGHIASNPALHRNLDFFLQEIVDSRNKGSKLFVANGSANDERFMKPAMKWVNYWQDVKDKPWQLETVILQGHSHFSAPPAAFRQGMAWLFGIEAQ